MLPAWFGHLFIIEILKKSKRVLKNFVLAELEKWSFKLQIPMIDSRKRKN